MIGTTFYGTLKKYENIRVEDAINIRLIIKHVSENSVQNFLDSFEDQVVSTNIKALFEFPVQWKKLVIDASDYIKNAYHIDFGDVEFTARLCEIVITRKYAQGSEVFEYSLVFEKPASEDHIDRLVVEAYLNYKEENAEGRRIIKEFDIKLELLDQKQTSQESIF